MYHEMGRKFCNWIVKASDNRPIFHEYILATKAPCDL